MSIGDLLTRPVRRAQRRVDARRVLRVVECNADEHGFLRWRVDELAAVAELSPWQAVAALSELGVLGLVDTTLWAETDGYDGPVAMVEAVILAAATRPWNWVDREVTGDLTVRAPERGDRAALGLEVSRSAVAAGESPCRAREDMGDLTVAGVGAEGVC
jgi:hypothetical protein